MSGRKTYARAFVILLVLALSTMAGCQKKGEEVPLQETPAREEMPMPALPDQIVVPEDVQGKWKAVVIEVTDKETTERTDFTVGIGEKAPLGKTGLTIFIKAFLPAFKMTGGVYTSSSADLTNPAAKVEIRDEGGALLYDRWLFAMYPATHHFEHEKYTVILKDFVANP